VLVVAIHFLLLTLSFYTLLGFGKIHVSSIQKHLFEVYLLSVSAHALLG